MATIGFRGGGGGEGGGLVSLEPVSTATGTTADVLNIPDDALLVIVIVDQVETNTANRLVLKLGTSAGFTGQPAGASMTLDASSVAADTARSKVVELHRIGDSNEWIARGDFAGQVTLTARLQRLQLTLQTISGNTNQFSGGRVAVAYSTVKGIGPIASTADLPEGTNGPYYYSDDRARRALSVQVGAIIAYSTTTGAFSTNATALNSAVDARIGAATISGLADVGTATAAVGDILVRGTQAYAPAGIESLVKFAEGSNVTIATAVSAAGVLTATITSTGGGGGGSGITTISAASDTEFSNLQNSNLPVYNSISGKWRNMGIDDVIGVSNTGANVTLGTALDGGVMTVSANVADAALALAKLTAGGATSGHVLTVSSDGNTVSAAAAASGGVTIEQVHDAVADDIAAGTGLTKTKNDSANTVTLDLDEAGTEPGGAKTGGDLTFASGTATISAGAVTAGKIAAGVIPQKASAQEVAEGDDTKFITAAQARSITESVEDGAEWSGFTYVSGTPAAGQFGIAGTNATGWVFTFATTDANATSMDRTFGENSSFRVVKDATNKIEGETQYAWRNGNSVSMKLKPSATETGDIRSGSVTLHGTGGLYENLKDQGFLENTDLLQGSNVTLTTSGNQVTISASGGSGGSTDFASQAEVNAGTETEKAIAPNTLRGLVATEAEVIAGTNAYKTLSPNTAHNLIEHLAHVATYSGFQNASSANDLPLGRWHINSTGTTAYFRGHTQAEAEAMTREFLVDRYFILRNSTGQRIEAKFSNVVSVAVSGSTVGILQCTIGDHSATPASPTLTGDWSLTILPEQNEQILENAPKASIPLIALAAIPGAIGFNATGGSNIGSTFGDVSNWTSNALAADNSNFMILPHPDQSTTPAGTGEMTFTPRSVRDSFMCFFNVGFGWINHNSRIQVNVGLVRKIGNGGWTFVVKKTNIINEAVGNNNDKTIGGFALDSPNTTEQVTYRWIAVKTTANANRIFPVGQSVAAIHIPAI